MDSLYSVSVPYAIREGGRLVTFTGPYVQPFNDLVIVLGSRQGALDYIEHGDSGKVSSFLMLQNGDNEQHKQEHLRQLFCHANRARLV